MLRRAFAEELDSCINRFGPGWESLREARLFITGGTGYFGRWLLPLLVRANETLGLHMQATVLSRYPRDHFSQLAPESSDAHCLHFHQGDVRDFEPPNGEFTHIVHGAATSAWATYHQQEDALTQYDTIAHGTRRVLEFAVSRKVQRVLFLGSGSLYGLLPPTLDRYPDDFSGAPHLCDPATAMGQGKRAAEFLCTAFGQRHGLPICSARCFSFAGPFLPLDLHYAFGNFVRDALWANEITVKGDGSPLRSYLYTGDLMVWLLTLLTQGQAGSSYNVGCERQISILELATLVGATIAKNKPVRILTDQRSSKRNVYLPDTGKARQEFGLRAWTSLEDTIVNTARFAQAARVIGKL